MKKKAKYPYSHKHIILPHGAIASVSLDCDEETIRALHALVEAAFKMDIKHPKIKPLKHP
jgi:hypothetical protein